MTFAGVFAVAHLADVVVDLLASTCRVHLLQGKNMAVPVCSWDGVERMKPSWPAVVPTGVSWSGIYPRSETSRCALLFCTKSAVPIQGYGRQDLQRKATTTSLGMIVKHPALPALL